jgi:hypothetical protein
MDYQIRNELRICPLLIKEPVNAEILQRIADFVISSFHLGSQKNDRERRERYPYRSSTGCGAFLFNLTAMPGICMITWRSLVKPCDNSANEPDP